MAVPRWPSLLPSLTSPMVYGPNILLHNTKVRLIHGNRYSLPDRNESMQPIPMCAIGTSQRLYVL